MQLQNTFGAFLVAFTMAHGAPILPENDAPPAGGMSVATPPFGISKIPVDSYKNDKFGGPANMIARDPKRSRPNRESDEMAYAKGSEVGGNAVMGLKTIMDDQMDKTTRSCSRKSTEDTQGDEPSTLDKMFGDDEDCEDEEGEDTGIQGDGDERYQDQAEEPSVEKRGKGGKGPSGKPPGGQQQQQQQQNQGSSWGQDLATNTAGTVISDGLWYGVDQAVNPPAKRSPKGGKGKGKDTSKNQQQQQQQQDSGSSIGQDILTDAAGNVISDGIWYGVDQATAEAAPVKRDPRGGGRGGGGRGGGGAGGIGDFFTSLFSSGDDENANAKRSPKGGKWRGAGQDIATDVAADSISNGIWYGVDAAANAKRSPKGGKWRGAGQDIATDVAADSISNGIWYGVDQAANAKRFVSKQVDPSDRKNRQGACAGRPENCGVKVPGVNDGITPDMWTSPNLAVDANVKRFSDEPSDKPLTREQLVGGCGGEHCEDERPWGAYDPIVDAIAKRSAPDVNNGLVDTDLPTDFPTQEEPYYAHPDCEGIECFTGVNTMAGSVQQRSAPSEDKAPKEARVFDNKKFKDWKTEPICSGAPGVCDGGDRDLTMPPSDTMMPPPGMDTISHTDAIAKRGRSRKGGNRGGSTSDNKSDPAKDKDTSSSTPKTGEDKDKDTSSSNPKTTDDSPAQGDANDGENSGAGSGGFRQGAKDTAKEMTQDIVTNAANDAIFFGIQAATDPGQGEYPVEGEVPVEGEAPVEGDASVEGEVPAEGEAPAAKRAVRFSA